MDTVFLVLALVALVVAVFWFLLRLSAHRIQDQYARLGERLQMEVTVPEPKLMGFLRADPFAHGFVEGRELSVSSGAKGLQDTRQVETVIKMAVTRSRVKLQLTKSGAFSGMRQRDSGGLAKWKSGDPDFDNAVDARVSAADEAARVLSAAIREPWKALLLDSGGTLYVGDQQISFVFFGLVSTDTLRELAEQVVDQMTILAERLEGNSD